MNDNIETLVRDQFGRLRGEVNGIAQGTRSSVEQLQVRVFEFEQKAARRGGSDSGAGSIGGGHRLSEATDQVIAGLRGSNSARIELPFSVRASLSSDAPGAGGTTKYPLPPRDLGPTSTYHPHVARLLDLLPVRTVDSGNAVTFVRVDYTSPGGNAAAAVAELAEKPQSSISTSGVTQDLLTYAHWIEVSKQLLDDEAELRTVLDTLLRDGLLDVVDAAVYSTLTAAANHTPFTPGAGETVGDSVARASATLAANGGSDITVALSPADYLSMTLLKATGSGVYLGVPATLAALLSPRQSSQLASCSRSRGKARRGPSARLRASSPGCKRRSCPQCSDATRGLRGAALVRDPSLILFGASAP